MTLRTHTEVDGTCGYCAQTYGGTPGWPCPPAQIALAYAGLAAADEAGRTTPKNRP